MNAIKKTIVRERKNEQGHQEWCALEVSLTPQEGMQTGRLSICGSAGIIMTPDQARKEALDFWESYFEDCPDERWNMARKFDRMFRTAKSAARFVVATDGAYHGLDIYKEDGNKVYILTSCGQIKEDLLSFFPEVEPYLSFHLNDMKAGCEHQDKLGWGCGRTIALDRHSATAVQLEVLDGMAEKKCQQQREEEFSRRWRDLRNNRNKAIDWINSHNNGMCSVDQADHLCNGSGYVGLGVSKDLHTFDRWLREDIAKEIKPELFQAEIYKDSLRAPCPDCGYFFGSKWLRSELPEEVIAWVESLPNER